MESTLALKRSDLRAKIGLYLGWGQGAVDGYNDPAWTPRQFGLLKGFIDSGTRRFYRPPPDLLKTLFRFPYFLLFGQFLLALALLLWSANSRFGAVMPLPPARTAGRIALIADAAALMDLGGHQAHLLQRYLQISVLDTARRLRAPPGLQDQPLIDWLDRAGKAAGHEKLCSDFQSENAWIAAGDLPRLYRAAHAIYSWKREMINGSDRRSKNH